MKKFKYLRVFPEKRGLWDQTGFTVEPFEIRSFFEKTVKFDIARYTIQENQQDENNEELVWDCLMNQLGSYISEQLAMPLKQWANVKYLEQIDIRDSPAYRFHSMYNNEQINLEDNGYKLLNNEVRKNLRKSVGILLGLQLRKKVEESQAKMEKMFLSIKRIGYLEKTKRNVANMETSKDVISELYVLITYTHSSYFFNFSN